jgi:hypothetical protein
MSYTVLITVTDCQTGKPIADATVTDGANLTTTDNNGTTNFEVDFPEGDPDLPDTVQISKDRYKPQPVTLDPRVPRVYTCLEPFALPPPSDLPPPGLPTVNPKPATLTEDNRIVVNWTAPQPYDKYLVWWTRNGISMPQVELVNSASKSGSWTATETTPSFSYTFKVKGGVSEISGAYVYSEWGPEASTVAVPNLRSLRAFLQASGISLPQEMRSLMFTQTSLRKFMKIG